MKVALRTVIPDIDDRLTDPNALTLLGSPITHRRFNRRFKGSYGPAIDARNQSFEWPTDVPIKCLWRCGDSVFPGIGVPAAAASGIITANSIADVSSHETLINKLWPPA